MSLFAAGPTLAFAAPMTLLIYLDQSTSMRRDNQALAKLIPKITQRIENACGDYRIGVSTIGYADKDLPPRVDLSARIIGTPRFVTRADGPQGVRLLEERIHKLATADVEASEEKIQTSIVESIERDRDIYQNTDLVATLLLSEATPSAEIYSAKEALNRIGQVIPLGKFMSVGITPQYPLQSHCSIDARPQAPESLDAETLKQPQLFFQYSGGLSLNYCKRKSDLDLEVEVEQAINYILSAAQCLEMM